MTFGTFLIVALLAAILATLVRRMPRPEREGPKPQSVIFRGWGDWELWLIVALLVLTVGAVGILMVAS
jgi:predicted MFS family arabinose efflux permease